MTTKRKTEIRVYSIPMTDEERKRWPGKDEICPACNQPFGARKMERRYDGTTVHRNCPKPSAEEKKIFSTKRWREKTGFLIGHPDK